MMTITRGLMAVTLAVSMLAWIGPAAHAQDNSSAGGTVGAPALRTFSLPGTRTTPPAETPAPQPQPAPPAAQQQVPAATPAPAAARRAPAQARTVTQAPAAAQPQGPVVATESPAFDPSIFDEAPATGIPAVAAPTLPATAPEAALWQTGGFWAALGAGLILLLGLVAYARSRARPVALAEPVALQRAAMPTPRALAPASDEARPKLELEFTPERVVATATEITVHYALAVRNAGTGAARKLRVDAQIFNASAEQSTQIGAFFATPGQPGNERAASILPGQTARLRASAVLRRDQVREVVVQGRPLFIPTVAISLVYEWGDAHLGQTSASYVVGVESQAADKMGPFRLDLGPRIYRSVGQRRLEVARVV